MFGLTDMLKRVELYLYFMRTWVRPSLRELLNCTNRCPCSLILVPSSRLPRSRSLYNGHWSSAGSFRSSPGSQMLRSSRSRFQATDLFPLCWVSGPGTSSVLHGKFSFLVDKPRSFSYGQHITGPSR